MRPDPKGGAAIDVQAHRRAIPNTKRLHDATVKTLGNFATSKPMAADDLKFLNIMKKKVDGTATKEELAWLHDETGKTLVVFLVPGSKETKSPRQGELFQKSKRNTIE